MDFPKTWPYGGQSLVIINTRRLEAELTEKRNSY